MEAQYTVSTIVIVVCLIFPGILFKRFYYQGQFTKQFGAGLFADRLITSIFWGTVVQVASFLIFSRYLGFTYTQIKPDIKQVYEKIGANQLPDLSYIPLTYILKYLGFVVFTASVSGFLAHKFIRNFKIDLYVEVFRFSNHWNYIFNGEILANKKYKALYNGKYKETIVDIVIPGEAPYGNKMLSGYLADYTISRETGELETIYLSRASKYSQTAKAFKNIPGHCFVVPYSNVSDLNIRYIFSVDEQKNTANSFRSILKEFLFPAGSLFIILYPWTLRLGIYATLLGIILSLLCLLQTVIITLSIFSNAERVKNRSTKWLFAGQIVLILLSLIISLLIFKVIRIPNQWLWLTHLAKSSK